MYKVGDTVTVYKKKFFGLFGSYKEGKEGIIIEEETFEEEDWTSISYVNQLLYVDLADGERLKVWTGEETPPQKYKIETIQ